jgi:hypothetical protein
MHGLRLNDLKDMSAKSLTAVFTFHHAMYLTEENVWKKN